MDDTICRSQYLRILVADLMGTPEMGDWRRETGIAHVHRMINELKGKLDK